MVISSSKILSVGLILVYLFYGSTWASFMEHMDLDIEVDYDEHSDKTAKHLEKIREADSRGLSSEVIGLFFCLTIGAVLFYKKIRPDNQTRSTPNVNRYTTEQSMSLVMVNLILSYTLGGTFVLAVFSFLLLQNLR